MGKLLDTLIVEKDGKYAYDWEAIEKVEEFAVLKQCEQNAHWHAEGTVWEHIKKVCDAALQRLGAWGLLEYNESSFSKTLLTAALFHDIGKGVTTAFKKGNWHAYNHEVESEVITRRLLADEDEKFRETICALVRWHMEPLRIYEHRDVLEHIVLLSRAANIEMLCFLKRCDLDGSIAEDKEMQGVDYLKVSELQSIASRLGCLRGPSFIPMKGEYEWLAEKNKIEEKRKSKQQYGRN